MATNHTVASVAEGARTVNALQPPLTPLGGRPHNARMWGPMVARVLALFLCGCAAVAAPTELRGVWSHATAMDTPEKAAALLARLEDARLNAIYPLCFYWGGTAYWSSRIAPQAEVVRRGFDPVAHWLSIARPRGIATHVRLVVGNYGTSEAGALFPAHPEWRLVDVSGRPGNWYDLGNPEVREFMVRLATEVAATYAVDGVQLDFVRYPGHEWGYTAAAKRGFRETTGYDLDPLLGSSLPSIICASSNRVGPVSTARPLAVFDNGHPAVLVNALGSGTAAVLNWQAFASRTPASDEILKRIATSFGASPATLRYTYPAQTRARYGQRAVDQMQAWLRSVLGYAAQPVDAQRLEELSRRCLLLLPGCYLMDNTAANGLELFVRGGGRAIFVDGPAPTMGNAHLRAVTGAQGGLGWSSTSAVLLPTSPDPRIPSRGAPMSPEEAGALIRAWDTYRESCITDLVRQTAARVHEARPGAQVTAAVFRSRASAAERLQDWPRWLREGLVDGVFPMAYTTDNSSLRALLDEWSITDPGLTRTIPGLAIYNLSNEDGPPPAPEAVLEQIRICRAKGAKGVCLFSANQLNEALRRCLREQAFAAAATSGADWLHEGGR